MPSVFEKEQKDIYLKMSPEEFWWEISRLRDFEGTVQFPQLSKLAEAVLVLPHSNAEAECVFSIVQDVKNTKRNRMANECLNAICVSRSSFNTKGIDCRSFEVRKEHLDKHNTSIYKS